MPVVCANYPSDCEAYSCLAEPARGSILQDASISSPGAGIHQALHDSSRERTIEKVDAEQMMIRRLYTQCAATCCGMPRTERVDSKVVDLEGVEGEKGVESMRDEKSDFPASLSSLGPKASSPVKTRVPKQNLSKL